VLLGVVSDTHGNVEFTWEAVRVLESLEVDEVLHCGDIGSPTIVGLFDGWPTHFVLGNVDDNELPLRQAIDACGQTFHGRFGELKREGRNIALLHSDNQRLFAETVNSGAYDLVCYGHTHVAEHHYQGKTLVLNPGALYRVANHTIAVVELPELSVTIVTV
jgi:putative phosphoesterase